MELNFVRTDRPLPVHNRRAFCDVYATSADGLLLASFLGAYSVVMALWAELTVSRTLTVGGYYGASLKRMKTMPFFGIEQPVTYRRFLSRFPDLEQAQLVMVVNQATSAAEFGADMFYFGYPDTDDQFRQFFNVWNQSTVIPASPKWTRDIWAEGLYHNLIERTAHRGMTGSYIIRHNESEWAPLIQSIQRKGWA